MKLEEKVAFITGAAQGIGRQIAEVFARAGAHVVIADQNLPAAERAAAEISREGPRALALSLDVTSEQQVEAAVSRCVDAFGRVDILVSNAGVQRVAQIEEIAFEDWKHMLAVHLDGAFLTTRACIKRMYASGRGGTIIFMGSVHAKDASVLKASYVTAKHGLIGLARVVAKEGAPHKVRSNVICPGFVRTELVEKQIPQQAHALGLTEQQVIRDVMLKNTIDGEFTTTDDVARVALFLASFPSMALSGQSVVVSHGWAMQ
jgi:3-hydroxybutyrate dehydrogenase